MKIILTLILFFHSFAFSLMEQWGKSPICEKLKIDYVLNLKRMFDNDKIQKSLVYTGTDKEFKKTLLIAGDLSKKAGIILKTATKNKCFQQSKPCRHSIEKLYSEYLKISKYYSKMYGVISSSEVVSAKLEISQKHQDTSTLKELTDKALKIPKQAEYWSMKRDMAVKEKDLLFSKVSTFCKPPQSGTVSL